MIASTEKEIAAILLKIKAVVLSPHKPFTFSSGLKSPIYCDNRLLMAYPELRIQVRDAFIRSIGNEKILCDCIGGTATAGIPHAAWIADKLRKPMIYIRSAEKAYGKNKPFDVIVPGL